jgi:hypothetical protein
MFYQQTQHIGPELAITPVEDLCIEHGADGADVRAGESDTQAEPAGQIAGNCDNGHRMRRQRNTAGGRKSQRYARYSDWSTNPSYEVGESNESPGKAHRDNQHGQGD